MFETKAGVIKPIVYVGIIKKKKLLLVEYKRSPNPTRSGWWIPAPGLEFGEDPRQKALNVTQDLGCFAESLELQDVESFVTPGGWHLIYHYRVRILSEVTLAENVKRIRWVSAEELAEIDDLAHGPWEQGVGQKYLADLK
jgi:ADP-ribose pyrophosphatase YjhB (NUDIX family)